MELEQLVIFPKIALELPFREQMKQIYILTKGSSILLGLYLHIILCFSIILIYLVAVISYKPT